MGSRSKEGECKVFRIGGVKLEMLKGKLRMYGPFFSSYIYIMRKKKKKKISISPFFST
jgi:hypothetical protein